MKRNWTILLFCACAAWLGGCGAQEVLLGTQGSYLFTAMDALALPEQQTDLLAQVRGGDLLRGRPDYAVRFYREGKLFKVAETDDDGVAAVTFTPPTPGDYVFTAALAPLGMADEPPPPQQLLLTCRAGDTPMVVVDLDKTVVATGFETVLIGSPEPMARSQDVLKRLAQTHTIVYLTHRPDYFSVKSKAWLAEQGYPTGPLLLSTLGGFFKGSGAFKSKMIGQLRGRFSRIEIGIGDKVSDAQAYHENGLRSFLIVQVPGAATAGQLEAMAEQLETLDEAVQVVTDWRQVEEVLFGEGAYPRSAMQGRLRELAREAASGEDAKE